MTRLEAHTVVRLLLSFPEIGMPLKSDLGLVFGERSRTCQNWFPPPEVFV